MPPFSRRRTRAGVHDARRRPSSLLGVWVAAVLQAQAPPAPPRLRRIRRAPAPAAGARSGGRGARPSQRPPQSATNDVYPAEQVRAGQALFTSQCGFCHGRDAMGGETGPDLTRSQVVAEDVRGDKIGPIVHSGRPDKGMPPFAMSEADLAVVVAYIHDQKRKAESFEGNRRTVDVADLQTGNAQAGEQYLQRSRRLREVPHADRRLRRSGDAAAGPAAAAAHALPGRPRRPERTSAVRADGHRHAAERSRRSLAGSRIETSSPSR